MARKLNAGDLTKRLELKQNLNCKLFKWFIENVNTNLKIEKKDEL